MIFFMLLLRRFWHSFMMMAIHLLLICHIMHIVIHSVICITCIMRHIMHTMIHRAIHSGRHLVLHIVHIMMGGGCCCRFRGSIAIGHHSGVAAMIHLSMLTMSITAAVA